MAKEKCKLCSAELETGFMDKVIGTRVKVKEGDSNRFYFVCPACQTEHGDDLKGKLGPK